MAAGHGTQDLAVALSRFVHGRREVCGGDVTRREELEMADQDSIQTGCGCLMMAIAFLIVAAAFRACVGWV